MAETIRVALVNDYEIVLEGLRALLRPYAPGISVVELDVRTTPQRAVDVTLFDTYGEASSIPDRVAELASDPTNGAIIVFSFSDDSAFANSLVRAGARGFISKAVPATQIVDGIRAAARGERVTMVERSQRAALAPELRWPGREIQLTERESELLALLPTGMTNRELAEHLYLSENTIKTQLRGLFTKLDVRNRVQAVSVARTGLLGEYRTRSSDSDGERSAMARVNGDG
jgi:DNA-binding NarL/FixJ family response regulator